MIDALYAALAVPPTARVRLMTRLGERSAKQRVVRRDALPKILGEIDPKVNAWVSVSTFGPRETGAVDNVVAVSALSVDLDAKPDGMGTMERCHDLVGELATILGGAPAVIVDTGHGVQAHWPIDDVDAAWDEGQAEVRERWMRLFRRFGRLVAAAALKMQGQVDPTFGIERVWRAPGTMNTKKDMPPAPARLLRVHEEYLALTYDEIDDILTAHGVPDAEPTPPPSSPEETTTFEGYPQHARARLTAYAAEVTGAIAADLRDLARDPGDGWDNSAVRAAFRLLELAESPWCPLTPEQARAILVDNMPTDAGFRRARVLKKWESATKRRNAGRGAPAPAWLAEALKDAEVDGPLYEQPRVDVTNVQDATRWLADNLGTGALSGFFRRGNEFVYTPLVGSEGYEPLTGNSADSDGASQIRSLNAVSLASKLGFIYSPYRLAKGEKGKLVERNTIFPQQAALNLLTSPEDATAIRPLNGVTHSATVRPDGGLITTPGYDEASVVLYLPVGAEVPEVPDVPTDTDVATATARLAHMLGDFRFVSGVDRANYLGLMLTPLLRAIAPGPYKMGVIEAHQPGSGKTFLARALTSIHGGVFRAEIPRDDVEFKKQITAIMDVTTGPVVVFDNITGALRLPSLAGLTTDPRWQDRRLGSSTVVDAPNDRLWLLTGNNMSLGGDLSRRAVRVRIDPGVPKPHLRTNFAIKDFEGWVRTHRTDILWALLVMIRHWVAIGRPMGTQSSSDSFGHWVAVVRGILAASGIADTFDDDLPDGDRAGEDEDEVEWYDFLAAIRKVKGAEPWTAAEILNLVDDTGGAFGDLSTTTPIPYEALPADLVAKRRSGESILKLNKSLGWWLRNRKGRWAEDLQVVAVTVARGEAIRWQVRTFDEAQAAHT